MKERLWALLSVLPAITPRQAAWLAKRPVALRPPACYQEVLMPQPAGQDHTVAAQQDDSLAIGRARAAVSGTRAIPRPAGGPLRRAGR